MTDGTAGQVPRDEAAERAVIGAVLLDARLVADVAAIVAPDDWYLPAHAAVWSTVLELAGAGQPIDPVSVAAKVGADRTLRQLGGALYVHELIAGVPAVAAAGYHARIVHDRANERRTVELGRWVAQYGAAGDPDPDTLLERLERVRSRWFPIPQNGHRTSWAPVDLADALKGDEDAIQPQLMARSDGACLLYRAAVHVLSGEPGTGKTFIALHTVVGMLAEGRPAAYVDFEDREHRVVARLLQLGARPDDVRDHLRYVRPFAPLDTAGRLDLASAVEGAQLAVVDGVTEAMTLHGLDLSSNPDVAAFYALLPRWIAAQGAAVVLIDHVVKDGERQGRWGIGGQHKLAGIDGAAYTVKAVEPFGRGRRGMSRLLIAKDRHGHVEEVAEGRIAAEFTLDATDPVVTVARLDPPELVPTTESGEFRPTLLMERVSHWLEANPGQTVNAVKAAGLGKTKYVVRALHQLVAEDYVRTEPGPRNSTLHTVVQPFHRSGDLDG